MKKILAALLALASAAAFGATTVPVQLLNPTGSSSGQAIVSTGASSAPAWGGIGVNGIAAIAANTVLANATGSSASPTAFAMPSCSSSASALQWTSGTGFACNSSLLPQASPNATGTLTVTNTSGNSVVVNATGNSSSGAQIFLEGNGATTPNKYLRAFSGTFQIVNSANSATPMSMDDAGDVTFTGSVTPSQTAGIVGTTTSNNANAGSVGEFVSSSIPQGSAISLTSGTVANIVSISLTAGDWDVWGLVAYAPAGTTVVNSIQASISTTSATQATPPNGGAYLYLPITFTAGNAPIFSVGTTRLSISSTTTVYLVAQSGFSTSTNSAYGGIFARRRR